MLLMIDNYDASPITSSSISANWARTCGRTATTRYPRRNREAESRADLHVAGAGHAATRWHHARRAARNLPERSRFSAFASAIRQSARHSADRVVRAQKHHARQGRTIETRAGRVRRPAESVQRTRYHSLAIEASRCPDCLEVTAWTTDDGRRSWACVIRSCAVEGVQFHPESILTQHGHELLRISLAAGARHSRVNAKDPIMTITPSEALAAHDRASRDLPRRNGRSDAPDHARRDVAGDGRGDPHRIAREEGDRRRDRRPRRTVMREFATKVSVPDSEHLVDIVGTGGDGSHTFNISTARCSSRRRRARRSAKHGGRSVSSKSGSADVLEALGANIDLKPEQVARAIAETGIGFMFAPNHHPAMKDVAPVRRGNGRAHDVQHPRSADQSGRRAESS